MIEKLIEKMSLKERINFLDETVVSASPNQVASDLGGEVAILNFQTGVYHGLDAVGLTVWEQLQSPATVSDLRAEILAKYAVDEETCDRDLKELLQQLLDAGLIEVNHGQTA